MVLEKFRQRIADLIYPEGKIYRREYAKSLIEHFTAPNPILDDLPFVKADGKNKPTRLRVNPLPKDW